MLGCHLPCVFRYLLNRANTSALRALVELPKPSCFHHELRGHQLELDELCRLHLPPLLELPDWQKHFQLPWQTQLPVALGVLACRRPTAPGDRRLFGPEHDGPRRSRLFDCGMDRRHGRQARRESGCCCYRLERSAPVGSWWSEKHVLHLARMELAQLISRPQLRTDHNNMQQMLDQEWMDSDLQWSDRMCSVEKTW